MSGLRVLADVSRNDLDHLLLLSAAGYTLDMAYDGDGRRVRRPRTALPLNTCDLPSGGQVVAEIYGGGVSYPGQILWWKGYVYLGGQMVAVQHNGVFWTHQDPVTKSQRLTNSSGTVTSTIDLDPWGGDTNRSSNQAFQPHRYTSYTRDANGGDDAMFRRYQPTSNRFNQPDPYDGSYNLGDPQSFNRYAYVQNDPVNFVDPTGLLNWPISIGDVGVVTVYDGGPDPFDDRFFTGYGSGLTLRPFIGGDGGGGIGGGGDGGGGGGETPPPVDKGYGWWGWCNRSASDLMATVRRDFSKFGNYSESVAGGLGVAWINFASGAITQGRNIAITVAAMSTAVPEISRARNMSVTVSSASTTSFTFTTNQGHLFYPGTISFSARQTASGVDFWIKLKGNFGDAESRFGFNAGGAGFEDRAWRSFLEKVRRSCGNSPR